MAEVIKEIDWNGNHYTFTNTFYRTGTKSHDILTMEDDNGNSWRGETTWINRPWHRFDLEEAFTEIVGKAFGKKALELIYDINKDAYSVEGAIQKFFDTFDPNDISSSDNDEPTISKKQALANYLEISEGELEDIGGDEFETPDGETYLVLNDDEANEEYDNYVESIWNDLGLEGLPDWAVDSLLEYALDEDWAEECVREDVEYFVNELSDEEVISECVDEEIVEEDDAYDEDGYTKDNVDIDDLRDKLIDKKFEDVDDYVEHIKDLGFDNDYFKDHIDDEKAVQWLKDDYDVNGEGRGVIASYDGYEIDLNNGYYAYRNN